ncbi:bifunctional uridylate/adenylate kinase [Lithohypha guttulata]|uniref:Uridylate kinase n=1 Tax=Lithohypha guttulata TaxID=1690604 RepID=A0AAN7Y9X8_9EURO|nr:bifunctional uridylate/adenylate kinase [Lithohypha guttulata]KAK5104570.1 bifunctional uridylate/adenylate kinase [Lithohypha guttulata]
MPAIPQIDPTSGAAPEIQPDLPITSANITPAFDPNEVTVVYILGGPGSGKGTQSANLVRDYGFKHLSAGDLLREEQNREGSQYGDLIKSYIKDGLIVPMEVTVKLLENSMRTALDSKDKQSRFLIDGFPRKMDQAVFFEQSVCPSKCTIFLDAPEDVMLERLLERGKTSGRSDDNEESIKKRFKTFIETSMPVVDMFRQEGKVVSVSALGSIGEIYTKLVEELAKRGISPTK